MTCQMFLTCQNFPKTLTNIIWIKYSNKNANFFLTILCSGMRKTNSTHSEVTDGVVSKCKVLFNNSMQWEEEEKQ